MRNSTLVIILLFGGLGLGQEAHIDPLSPSSLLLQIKHKDTIIGSATGFVVQKGDKYYLITNRHVVLQCIEDQAPTNVGGWICADHLSILHNKINPTGMTWFLVTEDLFGTDGKTPRWYEHPTLHGSADLVAVPLSHTTDVRFLPLDMQLANTDIVVGPGETVSIVGFPFGQPQEYGLPIWKTGTIASDPEVNVGEMPKFLVDTTSRPGMSGSPVYAVRSGFYQSASGALIGTNGRAVF